LVDDIDESPQSAAAITTQQDKIESTYGHDLLSDFFLVRMMPLSQIVLAMVIMRKKTL
jgi:hypothetical protein